MTPENTSMRSDFPFLLLIIISIVLVSAPVLINLDKINLNDDWLLYMSHHGAARISINNYHQLPLWSPFFGGGFPLFGHPEDPSLSPLVLPTLFWGEVPGLKINSCLIYLAGALGMFYLTRRIMNYSPWGASFSTLIYSLTPWYSAKISGGNYCELYFFLFPWFLAFFLQAVQNKKAIIGAVFLSLVILMEGKFAFLIFYFFAFLLTILNSFGRREGKLTVDFSYLKAFFTILFLTGVLGMIKILPMVELLARNAREIDVYDYIYSDPVISGLGTLFSYLFSLLVFRQRSFILIGWLPFLLFIISVVVYFKRFIKLIIILLIFALLLLPRDNPLNIFKLLWYLPGFHSINNPAKYFLFFIVFIVTLISGQIFTLIQLKLKDIKIAGDTLAFGAIIFSIIPLFINDININSALFNTKMPRIESGRDFFQVMGKKMRRKTARTLHSNQYFNLLRGVGTIDWNCPIRLPEHAQPKYFIDSKDRMIFNPEYHGEAYCLQDGNTAGIEYFSPNRIVLEVALLTPDKLVINQNFSQGWRSSQGEIGNYRGLIAVGLPPGEYLITLTYHAPLFYLGALISGISLLALILYILFWRGNLRSDNGTSRWHSRAGNQ